MKRRIAVLALAVGFIAAPAAPGLGAAAMDSCPPCCPKPADAPCRSGEGPCASLTEVSCCDAAPVAPASQAKRSSDPPTLQPSVSAARSLPPSPRHARMPRVGSDLALLTSPLRLSVVLLI